MTLNLNSNAEKMFNIKSVVKKNSLLEINVWFINNMKV